MFRMQIKSGGRWLDVKPSGKDAKPYQYETFREAERMLKMCYPDQCLLGDRSKARVVDLDAPSSW